MHWGKSKKVKDQKNSSSTTVGIFFYFFLIYFVSQDLAIPPAAMRIQLQHTLLFQALDLQAHQLDPEGGSRTLQHAASLIVPARSFNCSI